MSHLEVMSVVREEVMAFRFKMLKQLRERELDGENLVLLEAPILPLSCNGTLKAIIRLRADTNALRAPFLSLSAWKKITSRNMPNLFEGLYPLSEPLLSGFVGEIIKWEITDLVALLDKQLMTFIPWADKQFAGKMMVLSSFSYDFISKLGSSSAPFPVPFLLAAFDIFPDDDKDYSSHILHNYSTLFDLTVETKALKKMVKEDRVVLSSMNSFLKIVPIQKISSGVEPSWTSKDEAFYRKSASRIFAR